MKKEYLSKEICESLNWEDYTKAVTLDEDEIIYYGKIIFKHNSKLWMKILKNIKNSITPNVILSLLGSIERLTIDQMLTIKNYIGKNMPSEIELYFKLNGLYIPNNITFKFFDESNSFINRFPLSFNGLKKENTDSKSYRSFIEIRYLEKAKGDNDNDEYDCKRSLFLIIEKFIMPKKYQFPNTIWGDALSIEIELPATNEEIDIIANRKFNSIQEKESSYDFCSLILGRAFESSENLVATIKNKFKEKEQLIIENIES